MLIPSTSRGWLLEGGNWYSHMACLVLAGVAIAGIFRQYIISSDGLWDQIVRAAILPIIGSFLYLVLLVTTWWIKQFTVGGLTNLHDSLSAIFFGLLTTLFSFYVVIPYGMFCQYVLEKVLEDDPLIY